MNVQTTIDPTSEEATMSDTHTTQTETQTTKASDPSMAFLSKLMTEREVPFDLAQAWITAEREGVPLSQGAVSRAIDLLRAAPRRAGFDWRHRENLPSIVDEIAVYRAAQAKDAKQRAKVAAEIAADDTKASKEPVEA